MLYHTLHFQLFARSFSQVKRRGVREDVEEMRHEEHKGILCLFIHFYGVVSVITVHV